MCAVVQFQPMDLWRLDMETGTLLPWNSCCLVGYLIAQEGEERRRSSSIGAMGRKSDLEV